MLAKNELGSTGIEVSQICFGTLTLGPLQKHLSLSEGIKVLIKGYEQGINFYDTADMYKTYVYLRELLKIDRNIVICSRSYDYTKEGVRKRLETCLRELDRDYVDLFLLHEQESRYTIEGHWEAFEELFRAKKEGLVRAVGLSTHRIEGVEGALDFPEIEVVFPLLNKAGLGIEDGTASQMEEAVKKAGRLGKAVYTMKPLGGGNLIKEREDCFIYQKALLDAGLISSVAIGMGTEEEVLFNTKFFGNEIVDPEIKLKTGQTPRKLHIDDWCEGCGRCVERCHQKALRIENNRAVVDQLKCLRCGYCAGVCPVFAIKIV